MSIIIDTSDMPPFGRIVRKQQDADFPPSINVHLSITQAIKNARIMEDGKDFLWTDNIYTELPIRTAEEGVAALPPITVPEAFADGVRRYADKSAMAYKIPYEIKKNISSLSLKNSSKGRIDDTKKVTTIAYSGWKYVTWQMYWNESCRFAKSLIALGCKQFDRVVIMGQNSPFWAIANFGTIFAAGISAGIYPTNNVESTKYIVSHTESVLAVVDTRENLEKMLQVKIQCPHLRGIVMYVDEVPDGYEGNGVLSFVDFLSLGQNITDLQLAQTMELNKPGHCCSLVYTSGTTGNPKGVMLSHDNVCWTTLTALKVGTIVSENDCTISFLPLSHIAAQVMDMYLPMMRGSCVYFARSDALQGTLMETVKEVRPSWFVAVPRVWEKIEEGLKAVGAQLSNGLKKNIAEWAKNVGYAGTAELLRGRNPPLGFYIAHKFILNRIKKALGLDKCHGFGTCAAPLPKKTQEYFMSLGIPICDIFGMSEGSGPQTFTVPAHRYFRLGSLGRALPGTDVYIHKVEGEEDEREETARTQKTGELCFRGRNVFMGYFKNAEATRDTIDMKGFLHTGDTGYVDDDGFIYITGRIKELLITAGGENVAPVPIENIVKLQMPFVSNCQLIGDKKKYLSVLICLKSIHDASNNPTNNLHDDVLKLLSKYGSKCRTTYEAATDPIMNKIIHNGIIEVNKKSVSRAQLIRTWRIVPQDFTQHGGELTPTLKLKRNFVVQKYADLIETMYSGNSEDTQGATKDGNFIKDNELENENSTNNNKVIRNKL